MTLRDLFSRRRTPQHEALPGQVANTAGGHAFAVDDWDRLDRFLVLGSEDGTFYIAPRALTRENAEAVERCLAADGARVVARVVEISDAGRAPRNDPALFVLAMAAASDDPDRAEKPAQPTTVAEASPPFRWPIQEWAAS